jgi:hypothetical protein
MRKEKTLWIHWLSFMGALILEEVRPCNKRRAMDKISKLPGFREFTYCGPRTANMDYAHIIGMVPRQGKE